MSFNPTSATVPEFREKIIAVLFRNRNKGVMTHVELRRKVGIKDASYNHTMEVALKTRRIVSRRYNPVIGTTATGGTLYGGPHARAYELSERELKSRGPQRPKKTQPTKSR